MLINNANRRMLPPQATNCSSSTRHAHGSLQLRYFAYADYVTLLMLTMLMPHAMSYYVITP